MGYISDLRKYVGHKSIFMPCSAAVIIKNDKILLQKRTDDGTWATHGGSMEIGETFLETLNRELKEELNIEPINPIFIDIFSGEKMHHIYPNQDSIYSIESAYLVLDYNGTLCPDYDEVEEIRWFTLDDLPDNIMDVDVQVIQMGIKKYLSLKDRL